VKNLSPELWMVFIPGISAILFALGGSQISTTIKGKKWFRRFVLPVILGISVGIVFTWWQGLLLGCFACAMFHQGYGSGASGWGERALIFLGYSLISAPIGLSFWNIPIFFWCLAGMWISQTKWGGRTLEWKVWESGTGYLIGQTVAFALAGYGWTW
jgi:hypothetical protein